MSDPSSEPSKALHVLIIGGGIGGLCLAQGLRRAGIRFQVFERDRAPDARLQGYRLNIEPIGARALRDCLPPQLWSLLVATAGHAGRGMGVYDEKLRQLMREDPPPAAAEPIDETHAVSRAALRRLLLAGLGAEVTFGKEFVRFERIDGDQVRAIFADGALRPVTSWSERMASTLAFAGNSCPTPGSLIRAASESVGSCRLLPTLRPGFRRCCWKARP
jgi:2-polyprenyl-6-methoxyphenol hydroxylase-like FAD-dependent oxidoreductase